MHLFLSWYAVAAASFPSWHRPSSLHLRHPHLLSPILLESAPQPLSFSPPPAVACRLFHPRIPSFSAGHRRSLPLQVSPPLSPPGPSPLLSPSVAPPLRSSPLRRYHPLLPGAPASAASSPRSSSLPPSPSSPLDLARMTCVVAGFAAPACLSALLPGPRTPLADHAKSSCAVLKLIHLD